MENLVTPERLHHVLNYAPETGLFHWRNPPTKRVRAGAVVGCPNSAGYLRVMIDKRSYLLHRLAWLYVHSVWPADQIDHIDGNPLNNRITNLRESDQSQNMANARISTRNKSGVKGVSWSKANQKWIVVVKNQYLGGYDTKDEAAVVYATEARNQFGEFARLA